MRDGFPIKNVQIHSSVSIEPKNLERLLLWLRWKTFDEYEKIRLHTEGSTSALGLSMRALHSGTIQFIDSQQEQAKRLPALNSPPDFK